MSYQYTSTSTTGSRRLNEFVPSYVPKSDYLPTRVVDSNQSEANQWVLIHLSSSPITKDKRRKDMSTLKDLLNSTPTVTCRSKPPRMSLWIGLSPRTNSTAESGDTDLYRYESYNHHYPDSSHHQSVSSTSRPLGSNISCH